MLNNRIEVHSEDSAVKVFNGGDVDNPLMVSGYVVEIFDYIKKTRWISTTFYFNNLIILLAIYYT